MINQPMKATVLDLQGKPTGEVELPIQFNEEFRNDLIRRAFHAEASLAYQPKGSDPRAGLKTTAEYYGRRHAWRQTINTGRSRLPREKIPGGRSGRVLRVPHAVKGRRAHPPKPETKIIEQINKKEKNKAIRSALASSANTSLVSKKHLTTHSLPFVLTDDFENLKKSKDVVKTLIAIGLGPELQRVEKKAKRTSGMKRLRGRGKVVARSVLIVTSKPSDLTKAARNLAGVNVASVDKLNAVLLAPGGVAGRLVLWTRSAVKKLGDEALYY